jgi:ribonuclease T2
MISLLFLATKFYTIKAISEKDFYYVLAYSWTSEFCNENNNVYPGYQNPENYWMNYFTLHGLWEQYYDSGYPSYCSNEKFNENVPEEIGLSTMVEYWPNVKETEGSENYDDFWAHEWEKHGTCCELSQEKYFNDTINLIQFFGTPQIITNNIDSYIYKTDLLYELGGQQFATLKCDGEKLAEAYTCWDTNYKQIECTNDVLMEDTCDGNNIFKQ